MSNDTKRHTLYVKEKVLKEVQKIGKVGHMKTNTVLLLMIEKCLKGIEQKGVGYLFLDVGDIILSGKDTLGDLEKRELIDSLQS